MWTVTMFDLPVKEREERQAYTRFHRFLVQEGFMQLQFSVYARFCSDRCHTDTLLRHIKAQLPPGGQVRVFMLTDSQFGKQHVFNGVKKVDPEDKPEQLLLF